MEVLTYPNPILFQSTKPVNVFGSELQVLLESMYDTMVENNGVGLAANQVGLEYSMFVMNVGGEKLFVVNPKISAKSLAPANLREGCLSAPGEFLVLSERASWVEVSFQNEKGEYKKRVFSGIYAVCAQHEFDHLLGKSHLQSKSIPKAQRKLLAKKWGFKVK